MRTLANSVTAGETVPLCAYNCNLAWACSTCSLDLAALTPAHKSHPALWFCTQGLGFFRYNRARTSFTPITVAAYIVYKNRQRGWFQCICASSPLQPGGTHSS